MSKIFLSFGNERFIKSRDRIKNEAQALEYNDKPLFDKFIVETENIVNEKGFQDIIDKVPMTIGAGRGYFWYMWKPYIIHKTLSEMNDGDVLFYCDAGMKIYNNKNVVDKFINLIELVSSREKCETGIATFITTGLKEERFEYMYNTLSLFEHFGVDSDPNITNTQQCQAGVNIICKTEKSVEIVKQWYELATTHPHLFVCDGRVYPKITNKTMPGFRAHRHDQSVWSVLMKINKCNILTHDKNPMHQCHCRE